MSMAVGFPVEKEPLWKSFMGSVTQRPLVKTPQLNLARTHENEHLDGA